MQEIEQGVVDFTSVNISKKRKKTETPASKKDAPKKKKQKTIEVEAEGSFLFYSSQTLQALLRDFPQPYKRYWVKK